MKWLRPVWVLWCQSTKNYSTLFWIPDSWSQGLITPIFKSGKKDDPSNYRGICVASCLGKLFCSVLNHRLLSFVSEKKLLHPSHIGFLPGHRTADYVFTLRTLIDKHVSHQKEPIYACFVDFKKVFDSIWHQGLLYKLLSSNINGNFYNLIKDLYSKSNCSIKLDQHKTKSFEYLRGVRQGCILSPLLFNLYLRWYRRLIWPFLTIFLNVHNIINIHWIRSRFSGWVLRSLRFQKKLPKLRWNVKNLRNAG